MSVPSSRDRRQYKAVIPVWIFFFFDCIQVSSFPAVEHTYSAAIVSSTLSNDKGTVSPDTIRLKRSWIVVLVGTLQINVRHSSYGVSQCAVGVRTPAYIKGGSFEYLVIKHKFVFIYYHRKIFPSICFSVVFCKNFLNANERSITHFINKR